MNKLKSIKQLTVADKVNMGGVILDQALPHIEQDQIDPFLLIHHWHDVLPGGQEQKHLGVGPHPHRGFAPVTLIFKGGVLHQDSAGHKSEVLEGGTQWMNAGKGIIHSERPIKDLSENGGEFEIIQFWVNVPAKMKMDNPDYQAISKKDMKYFSSEDGLIEVGVVAGSLEDIKGPAQTKSDLLVLRLDYKNEGKIELDLPEGYNALMYNLNGDLLVNQAELSDKHMANFEIEGTEIRLRTKSEGRAIILAGKPINEPLATQGPFVMNNQEELMRAMRDFQIGRMGYLVEEF